MTDSNHTINEEGEITLKDFILLVKAYWNILWKRKWVVVIAGLIGGILFGINEYLKPIEYNAELTFMVNEDDGGGLGAAAAILGQFGFGGSSSEYNLDKIVELSKSRQIAENVLFDSIEINNLNTCIGNHIIEIYDFNNEYWKEDTLLNGFLFFRSDKESFSKKEQKALKSVFGFLIGTPREQGLLSCSFDELTGILKINGNTISEELSVGITNSLYDYLSSFYIAKSTDKQKSTVNILNQKVDSVYSEIQTTEYLLAKRIDNSQGFELRKDKVKEQELNRQLSILTIAYGELIKNKSTAEFLLETSKPFFSVIDSPSFPLDKTLKKYKMRIVFGIIFGGILSSLFFILQYSFKRHL